MTSPIPLSPFSQLVFFLSPFQIACLEIRVAGLSSFGLFPQFPRLSFISCSVCLFFLSLVVCSPSFSISMLFFVALLLLCLCFLSIQPSIFLHLLLFIIVFFFCCCCYGFLFCFCSSPPLRQFICEPPTSCSCLDL